MVRKHQIDLKPDARPLSYVHGKYAPRSKGRKLCRCSGACHVDCNNREPIDAKKGGAAGTLGKGERKLGRKGGRGGRLYVEMV